MLQEMMGFRDCSGISWTLCKQSAPRSRQITTATCQSTHTHTHAFNGPLSGTTQVSRYQKGKTNLDFTEARDSEWQWHQLAICKSAPRCSQHSTTQFFTGRMPFLPPNQQRQSSEGKNNNNDNDNVDEVAGHCS